MNTKQSHALHGLLATFVVSLTLNVAHAGEIAGLVTDSSNRNYLPGASVTIAENGRTEATDSAGRFRFANLPEGTYSLRVNYVGYDTRTESVKVPATGSAPVTIVMGDNVVKLDKLVVEGYREGRSRALQQKQTSTNIRDIVSSDAIGNLPDRNIAEALSRLPGVNMSLDQGEGRYVSIRGAEPNLNQVTMDGATMAAPGGNRLGRAVPLDSLGAGQISSIEVIKSTTPDLDANAVGGTLNIKSRSAFDHKGRFFVGSLTGNRNGATSGTNPSAQVTYTNTFGGDKWGLAASASYDKRNYANDWLQFGWSATTINGASLYLLNGFEIKPETGHKTREGINLNLEFRPDDHTQFYLRPNFSAVSTYENTFEIIYSAGTAASAVTLTSPTTGTVNTGTRSERREFRSKREQDLTNLVGGMKKIIGDFTFEGMLTYSGAKEDRIYDNSRQFRNGNNQTGAIVFDLGGGFVPVRWDVDPAVDVPSKYSLRRTREDFGIVDEKTYTAKGDLRWDSNDVMGHTGYLKTGYKFLKRARVVDLESRRLVPVGNWNLGQTGAQKPSVPVYDGRFQSLFLPDWDTINTFIAANPALTTHDLAGESANSIEDDYQIDEYIYAAYAMGSINFGKLTLLGGLRWEKTDATIRAVEQRTFKGNLIGTFPHSGITSYDKLFPNVQGVYRFTDQLLLRAAITQTIGRPAYEDARVLAILNYSDILNPTNPAFNNTGSVNVGNPALVPYFSKNYDVSLEYYAKKGGTVFAIAGFRKDIANPIYSYTETKLDTVYSGLGFASLAFSSKLNGVSGRISGVEFSLYQPFKFLPTPFDNFGVEANYTTISSSEVIPTRPGEDIPFFRQPKKIANLTLFYEGRRFSGRVAYSYAGEQIYTLGSNLLNDRYKTPRGQYDAQAKFRINQNYSITASVRNLTKEKDEMSFGIKNLVQMSRLLDRDYRVSLDFNF